MTDKTDRPIIFSAPMVRALLAGRKTQTRRIIKKPAALNALEVFGPSFLLKPGNVDLIGYAVGDWLWVRESINLRDLGGGFPSPLYVADEAHVMEDGHRASNHEFAKGGRKAVPSIHMPRWASRLTLIVEGVKVERLQDISEADAKAEGATSDDDPFWRPSASDPDSGGSPSHRNSFEYLWDSINGEGAWDTNPFVVAITFSVHRSNIDALPDPVPAAAE